MTHGRTQEQLAEIATRKMKDLHHEMAQRWGIPVDLLAGTTMGLGVTMVFELGYSEDQIIEMVRNLVSDLSGAPSSRGAS